MSESLVLLERPAERIARVWLNRPDKRNAFSAELRESLLTALTETLADDITRVVIIAGRGGHFSAGGDLASLAGIDAVSGRDRIRRGHALVRLLLGAGKPVIAAVEGYAMGAGAGLALACDTIVVDAASTLGFPFLKVGLGPDFGLAYTLPRRIGVARARHAFLHAKNFGGEEAVRCGLADEFAERGKVQEYALALAQNLAALPPDALDVAKRQFVTAGGDFEVAAEIEVLGQVCCFAGAEFAEGVAAFKEKRPPRF